MFLFLRHCLFFPGCYHLIINPKIKLKNNIFLYNKFRSKENHCRWALSLYVGASHISLSPLLYLIVTDYYIFHRNSHTFFFFSIRLTSPKLYSYSTYFSQLQIQISNTRNSLTIKLKLITSIFVWLILFKWTCIYYSIINRIKLMYM